jgi:hypothetical protein
MLSRANDAVKSNWARVLALALVVAMALAVEESAPVEESKAELEEELNFLPAFTDSVMMIWATELGDKTFFIAAILAMRYNRLIIFGGAICALAVMTVISAIMGFGTVFNVYLLRDGILLCLLFYLVQPCQI